MPILSLLLEPDNRAEASACDALATVAKLASRWEATVHSKLASQWEAVVHSFQCQCVSEEEVGPEAIAIALHRDTLKLLWMIPG